MVRLIATDLDGTLLSPDHSVSERNRQAIISAKAKGIEVIVATGRSFPEAYITVEEVGLKLPYICINGAEIRNENKELILGIFMSKEQVSTSIEILQEQGIHYDLFVGEYVYTTDVEKQIDMFLNMGQPGRSNDNELKIRQAVMDRVEKGFIREVSNYDKVLKEYGGNINKVLGMNSKNEQFINANKQLEHIPNLSISSSGEGNIEITNINAQKGAALKHYSDGKGIKMSDVMVIGDSYNDLSMMKIAGRSIAMGNAPQEIKNICT